MQRPAPRLWNRHFREGRGYEAYAGEGAVRGGRAHRAEHRREDFDETEYGRKGHEHGDSCW